MLLKQTLQEDDITNTHSTVMMHVVLLPGVLSADTQVGLRAWEACFALALET